MAEPSVAPAGPSNAASSPSTQRGVPYYEKLRRDLRSSLQKKRDLDAQLATIEDSIYRTEGAYLDETAAGNIIKGFDNYIKGTSVGGAATGAGAAGGGRRKGGGSSEADRVFSRSSISFMRSLDSPAPPTTSASTTSTPSHAPTPTSSFAPPSVRESAHATPSSANGTSKAGTSTNKKKKAAEVLKDEDEEEGKPVKRGKISYGRD
ncbi:hypothetical protein B0A49_10095 [Cryomyces minteri]|uniref:Chromatin modification-related protein EAF6 n=1 Tax=Cryomyces minteri TaxID=331657 RepID=A0A4V5NCW6_9PEZI|nr:hypothetical protein B0A49_10095 [Cryomyces minteri]